jgi:ABC-type multidrug transport system, ATPase and permease components
MASVGHIMGAQIETDMSKDLFEHLQDLSYSFYNNTKIGQLMARITSDLFDVTEFSHHCSEEYYIAIVKISVSFCILGTTNIWLTLLIFAFSKYNPPFRWSYVYRSGGCWGDLHDDRPHNPW